MDSTDEWFWGINGDVQRLPFIKMAVVIDGAHDNVLRAARGGKGGGFRRRVYLEIRAKEGPRREYFRLPVINSTGAKAASQAVDTLYRQARITKDEYEQAIAAVQEGAALAGESDVSNTELFSFLEAIN